MRKKNVLHLIVGLGYGGAEKVLLDDSIQFNKNKRLNSQVISFSNEDGLLDHFKKYKIKVISLRKSKTLKSFWEILAFTNSFVRSESIDVIHAHMFHAMLVAAILKIRNPKIKVVFTAHSTTLGGRYRKYIIFLLKFFRDIDILLSDDMKSFFHKSHNLVITNAVNIDEFKKDERKFDKFTFVAVANLREGKNYFFLIECAKKLKKLFDFQILIAGEGKLRDELQNSIQKEKIDKNIVLLGNVENVSKLMHQSHCLVRPSLFEGMPIAILEAGASKLPVISTAVGSIPSVLNKKYGYLASLDEFCDKMADVYYNYSDAQKKADKFYHQVVKEYTVEKMAKKLEDLYLSL